MLRSVKIWGRNNNSIRIYSNLQTIRLDNEQILDDPQKPEVNVIRLTIDGTEIKAKEGKNLLWTALDNGFYIPNLCTLRNTPPPVPASCRLCFVEIEGGNTPVTSCSTIVKDNMIVHLNTDKVKRIRNAAFELLLSHHKIDCAHCDKNRNCGLQSIAANLGLKLKLRRFRQIPRDLPVDSSHSLFYYNPNKCVLCGKCVQICREQGAGTLDFAFRGIQTYVSTFANKPLAEVCLSDSCLACVAVCPVGSLVAKPGLATDQAKAIAAAKL
jgi:bidirectional [NiFe] hydrogenase diaphorase subunit